MNDKPVPSQRWRELVSRLLKSEMSKRSLKYEDLSRLLAAQGTEQSAANLRNKINRGILGADLLLQLLLVMKVQGLSAASLEDILQGIE